MKNQYIGGHCLKRGTWTVFRFKGGLAKKREGVCFFSTSCKDFPDKTGLIPPTGHIIV